MSTTLKMAAASLAATLALTASALAAPSADRLDEDTRIIEVGAGAAVLDLENGAPVEALFRVVINASGGNETVRFVAARLNGDVTLGADGLSYMDIDFEAVGFDAGREYEGVSGGMTLFNVWASRNRPLGEELTVQVGLIGLKLKARGEITPGLEMFFKASADILARGTSDHAVKDIAVESKAYPVNFQLEFGTIIAKRVRIAFDQRFLQLLDGKFEYEAGDEMKTGYNLGITRSKTALELTVELTRNLRLFAQSNLEYYFVQDIVGYDTDMNNHRLLFMSGLSGRF